MSLHSFIPDSELPSVLKRPLVFGDRDQINASYALAANIALSETEKAEAEIENLKYFDVCIEYSGEQNLRILAVDKADAEKQAKEEADQNEADIEVDFISIREIKK